VSKKFFHQLSALFRVFTQLIIFFLSTNPKKGDDEADEDGNHDEEPPTPSCMDYIMHFLTLFWKIIFAFIPPTGFYLR
jgi:hypothetical protein